MNLDKDHENTRKQLWANAWIAVASASNCDNPDVPSNWADRCLKDFDQRFPAPTEDQGETP